MSAEPLPDPSPPPAAAVSGSLLRTVFDCAPVGIALLEFGDCRLGRDAGRSTVREGAARQVLHDEDADVALLAVVVHGHDVRVVDLSQDPGLLPEPCAVLGAGELRQLLDGHLTVEVAVATEPHDAELAAAELAPDLVVGKGPGDVVEHRFAATRRRRSCESAARSHRR